MICFAAEPVPVEEIHPAYMRMVDWLCKNPVEVYPSWESPHSCSAGAMFRMVRPRSGVRLPEGSSGSVGCLTMIRSRPEMYAAIEDGCPGLTAAIRNDDVLPTAAPCNATREQLLRFAQWQTALDRIWGRPEPTFEG